MLLISVVVFVITFTVWFEGSSSSSSRKWYVMTWYSSRSLPLSQTRKQQQWLQRLQPVLSLGHSHLMYVFDMLGRWRGVAVTRCVRSTKLTYARPG